mmetsp:Transcript_39362/g.47720  ORF Transcript_39362/g.47720 Transcript_39362/m.47720 type:complete len:649 (-) Transcript_39362:793-2739(-)|eukprot:CAMPEP_0197843868 /NCGR_PEP_ID=MMETSP1438-20131217/837_1 /TAXON_ID=1461541 /ORGANISM="Pterosperma sp., Strain CCMP1384" /LENGTH=648 /DNA_ID=CAMNT_0043454311 /DNA_START=130 /DNA_END=2076 /DNA_ORIENTATION=+
MSTQPTHSSKPIVAEAAAEVEVTIDDLPATVNGTNGTMTREGGNSDGATSGSGNMQTSSAASGGRHPLDVGIDVEELSDLMGAETDTLPQESDEGCHEYKRQLVSPSPERFEQLVTQMNYRLAEGQGEALYEIGVEDDGTVRGLSEVDLAASEATLEAMAESLNAVCSRVATREGSEGVAATLLVRSLPQDADHTEIRIATVGNVDSGKSTLIGVLTKGVLDNGRGAARANVFRHKHELDSGRTSSISQQVLGFAPNGDVTNYGVGVETHNRSQADIVTTSSKVLAFFDLAGHEKYFKTTLFGLTGHLPDYCMLALDSNRGGVVGMTKEHLGISLALKVPVFVVITKIDICSKHVLGKTLDTLLKLLKRPGVKKMPVIVRTTEDVMSCVKSINSSAIVPIFLVSCVEGTSLELLKSFLNHLPPSQHWLQAADDPSRLHIDDSFTVQGVGTVVAGTLCAGRICPGAQLLLGPNTTGGWTEVGVKSVRNKRVAVTSSHAGQTVAVALKTKNAKETLKKRDIRKGMVLVDKALAPRSTYFFKAEVLILVHPTTMKVGYTPIIHCLTVRQAAKINHIGGDAEVLRTGNRALVTFHFMYRPEYLVPGASLVFREGRTKGIGTIVSIEPDRPPPPWGGHKAQQPMRLPIERMTT